MAWKVKRKPLEQRRWNERIEWERQYVEALKRDMAKWRELEAERK